MQRGGRYRGRARRGGPSRSSGGSSATAHRLKGLFADGIWQCNCAPRLPAEHFKVKKEGPNKGRWFYTCQQSEPQRCDFFLWDEDAKPREAAAVLGNSRTEPRGTETPKQKKTTDAMATPATLPSRSAHGRDPVGMGMFAERRTARVEDDDMSTDTDTPPTSPTPARNGAKRTIRETDWANDDGEGDDDDFGWAFSGQDEAELTRAADTAAATFETPRKAAKTGVYATPATTERRSPRRLPWMDEPESPTTTRRNLEPMTPVSTRKTVSDYFQPTSSKAPPATATTSIATEAAAEASEQTPSRPRVRFESPKSPQQPTTPAATSPNTTTNTASSTTLAGDDNNTNPPTTPSPPTRHKDALTDPSDRYAELTNAALAALAGTYIPPATLEKLRKVLTTHDLRTQGVLLGRDVARTALRERDARIAELTATIARLEAARGADRAVVRHLRNQAGGAGGAAGRE